MTAAAPLDLLGAPERAPPPASPHVPASRAKAPEAKLTGKLGKARDLCVAALEDAGASVVDAESFLGQAIAEHKRGHDVWIVGGLDKTDIVIGRARLIDAVARGKASCVYVLDVSGIVRDALG